MERGTLVMTLLRSTVTTTFEDAGGVTALNDEGTVKSFGCQSSIKKPIVEAKGGSTCGFTTTAVSTGFGSGPGLFFFLHEEKPGITVTAATRNTKTFIGFNLLQAQLP